METDSIYKYDAIFRAELNVALEEAYKKCKSMTSDELHLIRIEWLKIILAGSIDNDSTENFILTADGKVFFKLKRSN
jgi:hypothetical protein